MTTTGPAGGETSHPEPSEAAKRLLAIRVRRGMSQQQLADRVGVERSFISQLETGARGQRVFGNVHMVNDLCQALRIDMGTLLYGLHLPANISESDALDTVADVQAAWASTTLDGGPDDGPPATYGLDELVSLTESVMTMRQALDYVGVGRSLPALITTAHALAVTPANSAERDTALRMVVLLAHASTLWLKNLAKFDLALYAAERGVRAALMMADGQVPLWAGYAEFARSQALFGMGTPAVEVASRRVCQAVDRVPTDNPLGMSVQVALLLSCAFAQCATGHPNDIDGPVAQAAELTARLLPNANHGWLYANELNRRPWLLANAIERGDVEAAISEAQAINANDIDLLSRRVHALVDCARAYGLADGHSMDQQAVWALHAAMQISPTRVVYNPWARQLVEDMYLSGEFVLRNDNLRGLVSAMGLRV